MTRRSTTLPLHDRRCPASGWKDQRNCKHFVFVPWLQALDRGAALVGADKIATGHNADDVAETVLLNMVRGDVPRYGCSGLTFPLLCRNRADALQIEPSIESHGWG
jgi:hypothetical protein